jgi:hypothetical protein
MKSLAAFSFPDVLVTMIISLLVVSAAFSVFRFSYNQIFHYKNQNEDYKQVYQLYAVFQEDVNRASEISCLNSDLQMLIQAKKVDYSFYEEMIVRKTSIGADSFFIDNKDVVFRLNNREQNAGMIDEVSFILIKGKSELPYKFIKEYSAEMKMELETLN